MTARLGRALAQAGHRTLLVSADLRWPTLHQLVEVDERARPDRAARRVRRATAPGELSSSSCDRDRPAGVTAPARRARRPPQRPQALRPGAAAGRRGPLGAVRDAHAAGYALHHRRRAAAARHRRHAAPGRHADDLLYVARLDRITLDNRDRRARHARPRSRPRRSARRDRRAHRGVAVLRGSAPRRSRTPEQIRRARPGEPAQIRPATSTGGASAGCRRRRCWRGSRTRRRAAPTEPMPHVSAAEHDVARSPSAASRRTASRSRRSRARPARRARGCRCCAPRSGDARSNWPGPDADRVASRPARAPLLGAEALVVVGLELRALLDEVEPGR